MKNKIHLISQGKLLLILSFILGYSFNANAQYIAESFEGGDFPPQGWSVVNVSFGNFPDWALYNSPVNSSHGKNVAWTTLPSRTHLITSGITLEEGEEVQITFDYKTNFTYREDVDPIQVDLKITVQNEVSNTIPNPNNNILNIINSADIANSGLNEFITHTITFVAPSTDTYFFGFYNDGMVNISSIPVFVDDLFELYLDRIVVEKTSECAPNENIAVENIEETTATVNWSEDYDFQTYQIQLLQSENPLPTDPNWTEVDSENFVLTDLTPGSKYSLYARSICSSSSYSTFSEPIIFETPCADIIEAPYFIPFFESETPGCWTESGEVDWRYNTQAGYDARYAGDHTLLQGITNYAWVNGTDLIDGKTAVLTSPKIDIAQLQEPALEFYVFSKNTITEVFNHLSVEVYNDETWTSVMELTSSSDGWKFYSIDLTEYEESVQVRFKAQGNLEDINAYYNNILIDDISVKNKTTCVPIENVIVTSITGETAIINGNSMSNIDLAYGKNFIFNGAADFENIDLPHTLNDLQPQTEYEFYLRPHCSETVKGEWQGPYYFTTDCSSDNINIENLFNFSAGITITIPNCWKTAAGGDISSGPINFDGGGWFPNSDARYGYFTDAPSVSCALLTTDENSWLISPWIDFSADDPKELKITTTLTPMNVYSYNLVQMGEEDEIQLVYTTDEESWHHLKTWSSSDKRISGTFEDVISLAEIANSTVRFAFIANTGTEDVQYLFHVHNFEVRSVLNCPEPLNLMTEWVTNSEAQIIWENNDSPIQWEYALNIEGEEVGDWIEATADNSIIITELTPDTDYEFHIRPLCDELDYIYDKKLDFTTQCDPIDAPFIETFVSQSIPSCWDESPKININENVIYWNFNTSATFEAADALDHTNGETYYAWLNGATIKNNELAFLTTRLIDISNLNNPALQFYLFSKNSYDAAYNQVVVQIFNGSAWEELIVIDQKTGAWLPYILDINHINSEMTMVRFKIKGIANGGNLSYNDILLDDIGFIEMPDCPPPFNIQTTNISSSSVEISWDFSILPEEWEIEIGLKGFQPGSGNTIQVTSSETSILLDELDPDKEYDFYLKAVCTSESEQIGPFTFKTEKDLNLELINHNSIQLYPNPTSGFLYINSLDSIDKISIYNLSGQRLRNEHPSGKEIDLNNFSEGIYFIEIHIKDKGKKEVFKIIKK